MPFDLVTEQLLAWCSTFRVTILAHSEADWRSPCCPPICQNDLLCFRWWLNRKVSLTNVVFQGQHFADHWFLSHYMIVSAKLPALLVVHSLIKYLAFNKNNDRELSWDVVIVQSIIKFESLIGWLLSKMITASSNLKLGTLLHRTAFSILDPFLYFMHDNCKLLLFLCVCEC